MQPRASLLDELTYTIHLVGRQIVHHDYVSGLQLRTKHLFEKGQKDIAVGSRFDGHRGHPAGRTDSAQHCQRAPVAAGNTFADALATPCPAVASGHFCCHAALVEKDQLRRVDPARFRQPVDSRATDRFAILFGGVE